MLAAFHVVGAQEPPLNGFDDYVNKSLRDWEVPGLAIAIVKDDRIVLANGVRKLGDPAPLNEQTLFAIGSSSKAFTAASIAMLVDEGKMKWDDPVTKYLPGFELYDPYVTRELKVRDLLSHRSGLSGAVKEMWTSQTVIRAEPPYSLWYPEAHFLNYGLGWFLHDYRGPHPFSKVSAHTRFHMTRRDFSIKLLLVAEPPG